MNLQNVQHYRYMKTLSDYKRFYAFGDSYTKYYWPTYADIIGNIVPYYENWGLKGAGNHYIFNSIVECNQRNMFNHDDLVIVMWSGVTREDRYVGNRWDTAASDYRKIAYGEEWMRKYGIEIRGNVIRDLAYIKSIQVLLNSTKCDYVFLNSVDIIRDDQDVIKLYSDILDIIKPSLYNDIKNSKRPNFNDMHPTPVESTQYIKKHLAIDLHSEFVNHWEKVVWDIKVKNILPVPYYRPEIHRL